MVTSAITFVLQVLPPLLKWMGFRDEQIQKFIAWVQKQELEAPSATIPADEEAKAKAALLERIKKEQQ